MKSFNKTNKSYVSHYMIFDKFQRIEMSGDRFIIKHSYNKLPHLSFIAEYPFLISPHVIPLGKAFECCFHIEWLQEKINHTPCVNAEEISKIRRYIM